jgi:ribosome-associated protein
LKYSELVKTIVAGIKEGKGEDITILNLCDLDNTITDYFVICSANSNTHADGIASHIANETMKVLNDKPWHEERDALRSWVLLDYVSVVVHVFLNDTRAYYNIEDLWADAERIDV